MSSEFEGKAKAVKYFNKRLLIGGIIISVCLQMTDIKLFNIKIGELIILVLFLFHINYFKKVHKYIVWFAILLVLLLIKTIIQDFFTVFYINTPLSVIKRPGIVSVSRFVEIFCCLFFVVYVVKFLQSFQNTDTSFLIIYRLVRLNIYLPAFFFFIFYLVYYFHLLHVNDDFKGFLVYDTTGRYAETTFRLKGLYVEGGPLGLFYSYIFVVYEWVLKKVGKKDFFGKVLIILIIVFASSKAGYSMLLIYLGIKSFDFLKQKIGKNLALTVIPFFLILGGTILYFILYSYISTVGQELTLVVNNTNDSDIDGGLAMGRVSGLVIVPNMIKNNLLTGIGLGNYPLLRNNPTYLDYFPVIPTNYWDSSGLGGIVDFLTEGGLVIFLIFVFIIYNIYTDIRNERDGVYLFYSFVGPFIFGVQFHFFYPWLSLALIIFFIRKKGKFNVA